MSTEPRSAAQLYERSNVMARLIADQLLALRAAGETPVLVEDGRPTLLGSYLESYEHDRRAYEDSTAVARGKVT